MWRSKTISGLLLISTFGINLPESLAGEHPDGTVFFEASPRLETIKTTLDETQVRGATYYITLTLPSDAGEPLSQVLIQQRRGIDDIPLLLDKTTAFMGTPRNQQEPLTLAQVAQSEDYRDIQVQFQTPVSPGSTVTIGLKPRKNPQYDGVYLFGVTAFPAGETTRPLYLGVRRLHFYDRRNDSDFRHFP